MLSFLRVSSLVIVAGATLSACGHDDDSSTETRDSCGDGICADGETSMGLAGGLSSGTDIDLLLADCTKDVDKASIARHLEPALDIVRATRPLESEVRDTVQFATDANSVLYTLSENPSGSALKAPFAFDSATGRYHSTAATLLGIDGTLDIEVHFGAELPQREERRPDYGRLLRVSVVPRESTCDRSA